MSTTTYGLVDGDLGTEFLGVITPAELMNRAAGGLYSKAALASLLTSEAKYEFLAVCAAIEKKLTDECAAKQDFCLESGCAVEGEVCLEAVLNAGTEYSKAFAAEWSAIFANQANRIEAWRT